MPAAPRSTELHRSSWVLALLEPEPRIASVPQKIVHNRAPRTKAAFRCIDFHRKSSGGISVFGFFFLQDTHLTSSGAAMRAPPKSRRCLKSRSDRRGDSRSSSRSPGSALVTVAREGRKEERGGVIVPRWDESFPSLLTKKALSPTTRLLGPSTTCWAFTLVALVL